MASLWFCPGGFPMALPSDSFAVPMKSELLSESGNNAAPEKTSFLQKFTVFRQNCRKK